MSRWHTPSCQKPDISVKNTVPYCKECDRSPDLDEIISNQPKGNSLPPCPIDEAAGEMNLWWPPSVPYAKGVGCGAEDHTLSQLPASSFDDCKKDSTPIDPCKSTIQSNVRYSIYDRQLNSGEIRLICVSENRVHDYPVHVSLEVYDHDHWPDYETVSYTWGGEENDNTFCKPVYIGPFWDILLQTKNCHAMLQFLRPSRGVRLVWVDAICINQTDFKERSEQVAHMGRIYRESEKVIVYLGPDIVVNTPNPRRLPLKQLGMDINGHDSDTSQTKFHQIISRRYFNRLWIIQELLLAPRIVFRINDTNYWFDAAMEDVTKPVASGAGWNISPAPWIEYMSKGEFSGMNVFEVAAITSKSSAGDPRDRIFGVLGLVGVSDEHHGIRPNYALSSQHIFIGFFAHCLINLKVPQLLLGCTGDNDSTIPSWVPGCRSPHQWEKTFFAATSKRSISTFPIQSVFKDFFDKNKNTDDGTSNTLWQVFHHPKQTSTPEKRLVNTTSELLPWNKDIAIDPSTGSLFIYLTHYFTFPFAPSLVGQNGHLGVFRLQRGDSHVYMTSAAQLDILVRPNADRLYILETPPEKTLVYLILRTKSARETFELVAACEYVCFAGNPMHSRLPMNTLDIEYLQSNAYTEIEKFRTSLNSSCWVKETLRKQPDSGSKLYREYARNQMFPWISPENGRYADLIHIYKGILNDRLGYTPGLVDVYTDLAKQNLNARISDEGYHRYLEIKFSAEEWAEKKTIYLPKFYKDFYESDDYLSAQMKVVCWEWRCAEDVWMNLELHNRGTVRQLQEAENGVSIRASLYRIYAMIKKSEEYSTYPRYDMVDKLEKLCRKLKCSPNEAVAQCEKEPEWEKLFIPTPEDKPFELLSDMCEVSGLRHRVCIV